MSETTLEKNAGEKGTISIQMENIFPIIKKWLYSDHEIFVRELVSNSIDAINKFKHLVLIGEAQKPENTEEYFVQIQLDKINNTLTFIDNGIGMTAEEIKKYINQVAFSGAEEFVKKYKSGAEKDQIIGHFGLGFYSSFMVAKKVEINTLSFQEGAEPVRWECTGTPEFEISSGSRKERGTEIILHLADDAKDYLEEIRIKNLIKKYCDFLPYRIDVNGVKANKQTALWNEQPTSLKKEDYIEFYNYLHPFSAEPKFWIHVNVDYPFNLKGILYFPQLTHELDVSKGHVKLFCNNVYVSDNTQEILPRFLTVLQGGIDSPDIPLNVSRSMLQHEPYVRKISSHIAKKVADRLKELYKKERTEYIKTWESVHAFVKVGAMEDEKFYDQVKEALIYQNTDGEYLTLDEYLERNKERNDGKVYYCSDKNAQSQYINMFKNQALEVLVLDSFIDSHFINYLEMRSGSKFTRIDSDISENLVEKENSADIIVDKKTNRTANEVLADLFKKQLSQENLKVKVESLKSEEVPSMLVFPEHMRRMHEMTSMMQQQEMMPFQDFTLIINANNPIVKNLKILSQQNGREKDTELICNHLYELALLSQKQLAPDKIQGFLERSHKILELFSNSN